MQCPVYSSVAPKNWKWPLKSKTQLVMGTDWAAGNPGFGVFYCSQRTDCLDIELNLYWGVLSTELCPGDQFLGQTHSIESRSYSLNTVLGVRQYMILNT